MAGHREACQVSVGAVPGGTPGQKKDASGQLTTMAMWAAGGQQAPTSATS